MDNFHIEGWEFSRLNPIKCLILWVRSSYPTFGRICVSIIRRR